MESNATKARAADARSNAAGAPLAIAIAIAVAIAGSAQAEAPLAGEVESEAIATPAQSPTANEPAAETPTPESSDPSAAAADATPTTVEAPAPSVTHAAFTSSVEDREPVDSVTFLENDRQEIIFFTELRNLDGHIVTHRWLYDGEEVANVAFDVAGNRWRVWSRKTLDPKWLGVWKVAVVDENDVVIETRSFTYSAAEAPAELTP